MKRIVLATVAIVALSLPANAVTLLGFEVLQNPVPQSQSAPCVICASNQAHNPVGFGFNDFVNTGNDTSFNLFSSNITGAFANNDQTTVTPYTGGQLLNFLQNAGFQLTFDIAVDINTAGGKDGDAHFLEFFQLINAGQPGLGDETVLFSITNQAMPVVDNGNGKADYLITGFSLAGIQPGDRLLFRAQWSGASDGGESFYLVPRLQLVDPVPIPPAVALFASGLAGLGWLARRRKQKQAAEQVAA